MRSVPVPRTVKAETLRLESKRVIYLPNLASVQRPLMGTVKINIAISIRVYESKDVCRLKLAYSRTTCLWQL